MSKPETTPQTDCPTCAGTGFYTHSKITSSRGGKVFLRREDKCVVLGYEKPEREPPYYGPQARISHDDTWLHITTDDYEGHAMLNIETLPVLIRALQAIQRIRS